MKTLLRIDASARSQGSYSRSAGDDFTAAWKATHGSNSVLERDLVAIPIPHIANATIEGMFSQESPLPDRLQVATALSDQLIAEIQAADALLITVPMYNFGIPSSLKAWIDQISRVGKTFSFDGKEFKGLMAGKPVYVVCAYGATGYLADGGFSAANFVEAYLKFLLNFLGFNPSFLSIQGTSIDAEAAQRDASAAKNAFAEMIL